MCLFTIHWSVPKQKFEIKTKKNHTGITRDKMASKRIEREKQSREPQGQFSEPKERGMKGNVDSDEKGGKKVDSISKEEEEEQSQIHDDWSKIEKAISSLSNKTLDDCVKRLNESVFKKIYKYKCKVVDEIKDDISITTFDDDVKTQQHNYKQEMRQFISKPVMLYVYIYILFFLSFFFVSL